MQGGHSKGSPEPRQVEGAGEWVCAQKWREAGLDLMFQEVGKGMVVTWGPTGQRPWQVHEWDEQLDRKQVWATGRIWPWEALGTIGGKKKGW